jgi:hypothetical protein
MKAFYKFLYFVSIKKIHLLLLIIFPSLIKKKWTKKIINERNNIHDHITHTHTWNTPLAATRIPKYTHVGRAYSTHTNGTHTHTHIQICIQTKNLHHMSGERRFTRIWSFCHLFVFLVLIAILITKFCLFSLNF